MEPSDPHGIGGRNARSLPELLSDLFADLTGLFKSEGRLVRSEIMSAIKGMAAGAEMVAAGALLILVALIVLVQAVIIALTPYLGAGLSAAAVGACLALFGAVLMARGRENLKSTSLVPERTIEQTSRDVRLAKEQL